MKDYHLYTSDVMHCRQEDCKMKTKCYRYWLSQQKKDGIVTMFLPDNTPENCEYYLNLKNY